MGIKEKLRYICNLDSLLCYHTLYVCEYKRCPLIVWNQPTNATVLPCSRPSILLRPAQPSDSHFLGSADSPPPPPPPWKDSACVYPWAVAVCKLLPQTKVALIPTNILPVIIENSFRISGFLRWICGKSPECHKVLPKSDTLCSWEQQSYPGATWASVDADHVKRRLCPSLYYEAKGISLSVQDQGGVVHTDWRPCICPKMFSSSWISQDIQANAPNWPILIASPTAFCYTGIRTGTIDSLFDSWTFNCSLWPEHWSWLMCAILLV